MEKDCVSPKSPCEPLSKTALLIDETESALEAFARGFGDEGFLVTTSTCFKAAGNLVESLQPDVVVCELRVNGKLAFDFISHLRLLDRPPRVVIATAYPSVASAFRAVQLDVAAYITRPTTASYILERLQGRCNESENDATPAAWPSLDRTIWEYLNQVFLAEGSISATARRLRIDRRSLRRMLAKYPPSR
jgi:two-component system response regulator RegA